LSTFVTIFTFQKKSYQPPFARSKPVVHHLEDSPEEVRGLETGQLEGVVLMANVVVMMIRKPVHLVNSNHLFVEAVKEDMEETDLHMKVEVLAEVGVVVISVVVTGEMVVGRGEKVVGRGEKVVLEEALEGREERGKVVVLVTGKVVVLGEGVVDGDEGPLHLSKQQRTQNKTKQNRTEQKHLKNDQFIKQTKRARQNNARPSFE